MDKQAYPQMRQIPYRVWARYFGTGAQSYQEALGRRHDRRNVFELCFEGWQHLVFICFDVPRLLSHSPATTTSQFKKKKAISIRCWLKLASQGALASFLVDVAPTACKEVCVHAKLLQSCQTLCDPMDQPARLLCPWDSVGKNTGVGCRAHLQGLFQSRDQTCVSYISCIGRWVLYHQHHLESQISMAP